MQKLDHQYHIHCVPGDVGRYVILPGDPGRCEKIAALFDDAHFVAQNREYTVYTGTLLGEKVSVCSTGIGGPSASIAMEELHNIGADTFIRVGTCGAVNRDVEVGSLILAMGCCSNSNFASQYHLPGIFAPLADYGLLESAVNQARILEAPFYVGNVYSSDVFYEDLAGEKGQWEKMGVLAQEMETMSLYCTAARAGKKALTMLTVGSSIHSSKALTNEEREKNLDTMIRCALEVA